MPLTTVQGGMIGTVNSLTNSTGEVYGGLYGFRNRIINGDCRIDQRNNGASVTPIASTYTLDRWLAGSSASSKFSVQRNAASVTTPIGFTNYIGNTSLSAYSVSSTDFFTNAQIIEGFNIADFAWGTANAQPVTISFWVRSSLTGTFGGSVSNGGYTRTYPFVYTISSANTWEQKSVTIAGDTTGTWATDNTAGLVLKFSLGAGSTYSTTAGAWAAGNFVQPTGSVSVVGTNGATFYITGVQLEKGSTATSFDYRPYGTELALCQRYFEIVANGANSFLVGSSNSNSGNEWDYFFKFLVQKRVNPTGTVVGSWTYNNTNAANSYIANSGLDGFNYIQIATATGRVYVYNTGGGYMTFSAEL